MKVATIMMAGTAALLLSSAALAQNALTGTITKIDRTSGTIAIQQTPSGTVGSAGGGAAEQYKLQSGLSVEDWHAGDQVNASVTEAGGVKTITKLAKP
jgi:Cu/Ag efflux protein CusF